MRTNPVRRNSSSPLEPSPLKSSPTYHLLRKIERTLPAEMKMLKPFSNSRLEGISECPIWGVVHMQRQYPQHGRPLALEAGEAMHQFFAAFRIWQLDMVQGLHEHAKHTGIRVFGEDRWTEIWKRVKRTPPNDIDRIATLAHEILHTSGYYDDPKDQTRTLSNMETAAVVYARETLPYIENWPIWVESEKKPRGHVGIEQVFDVILEYEDGTRIRYIGTLDGILRQVSKS